MLVALLSTGLVCVLGLPVVLFVLSPGKPKPFLDKDGKPLAGSVSERIRIDVNGVEREDVRAGRNFSRT